MPGMRSIEERSSRLIGGLCRRARQLPGWRGLEAGLVDRARRREPTAADPAWRQLLADLDRHGLHRTTFDSDASGRLFDSPWLHKHRWQKLDANLPEGPGSVDRLPRGSFVAEQLYLAGLAPPLLAVARAFLELPPLYLGSELWRERPDGALVDVRQWHRDVEDRRLLKIVVYLSEVGLGDGPFEYLRPHDSARLAAHLNYRSGFIELEAHSAVAGGPPLCCHGPAGTILLFDGARLFHRAQPPVRNARLSLTFTYASRYRLQVFPSQRPPRALKRALRDSAPDLVAYLP